jgi:hypothetical protein
MIGQLKKTTTQNLKNAHFCTQNAPFSLKSAPKCLIFVHFHHRNRQNHQNHGTSSQNLQLSTPSARSCRFMIGQLKKKNNPKPPKCSFHHSKCSIFAQIFTKITLKTPIFTIKSPESRHLVAEPAAEHPQCPFMQVHDRVVPPPHAVRIVVPVDPRDHEIAEFRGGLEQRNVALVEQIKHAGDLGGEIFGLFGFADGGFIGAEKKLGSYGQN